MCARGRGVGGWGVRPKPKCRSGVLSGPLPSPRGPPMGRLGLWHVTSRQPWQSPELGLHNCPPCPPASRQSGLAGQGGGRAWPSSAGHCRKALPKGPALEAAGWGGAGSAPGVRAGHLYLVGGIRGPPYEEKTGALSGTHLPKVGLRVSWLCAGSRPSSWEAPRPDWKLRTSVGRGPQRRWPRPPTGRAVAPPRGAALSW